MWAALSGPHHRLAERLDELMWYPPSVAPFAAMPSADKVPDWNRRHRRGFTKPATSSAYVRITCPPGWQVVSRSHNSAAVSHAGLDDADADAGTILGEADPGRHARIDASRLP